MNCLPLKSLAGLWLTLCLACAAHAAPAALPTFVLAGTDDTMQSFYGKWLVLIYADAFRRLGFRLTVLAYPAKRASALADEGLVDGELQRVAEYGKRHPNLVRVAEPHFKMACAAYGIGPKPALHGWSSLKGSSYRVEYRGGIVHGEAMLQALVPAERLSTVTNVPLGLRKLLAGRTDLFVDGDWVVDSYLGKGEFAHAPIRKLGVLEEFELYAYLHRRHAALAPQLARVLRDMKSDNLIERYRKQAEVGSH